MFIKFTKFIHIITFQTAYSKLAEELQSIQQQSELVEKDTSKKGIKQINQDLKAAENRLKALEKQKNQIM